LIELLNGGLELILLMGIPAVIGGVLGGRARGIEKTYSVSDTKLGNENVVLKT
jgi:hypothetical protein